MKRKAAVAPSNRCLFFIFLWALLCGAAPLSADELDGPAQKLEVGSARLIADDDHIAPGERRTLFLSLDLPTGWHTYWVNPGDTGLTPTWKPALPSGAHAGPIRWPLPQKIDTEGFTNYGYGDAVLLPVPLQLDPDFAADMLAIRARIEWLVCKDICLPETADVVLDWPVRPGGHAPLSWKLQAVEARVPTPQPMRYNYDERSLWALVAPPAPLPQGEIYVETVNATKLSVAPRNVPTDRGAGLVFARGITPGKDGFGFVGRSGGAAYAWEGTYDPALAEPRAAPAQKQPLWIAFALAFLGGALLNFLPCVLPVLSLKILGFFRSPHLGRRQILRESLFYALGVESSFVSVAGLLLALRHAGKAIGWGFQLQQPVFVLSMALLTFLIGLMLSGVLTLPALFGQLNHRFGQKSGHLASFMTGVLAVQVATPCTAPFMASAVGFALTLKPLAAMLVFLSMATGMASPFLLIGLFPPLQRWLPKPGRWMETLKEALAFPMYATAAWLIWVLAGEAGPLALGLALTLLVTASFALWCANRLESRRLKMALLLALLAGIVFALVHFPVNSETDATREIFSQAKLDQLRQAGTPVLVDATADWCLTCKLNERVALDDAAVRRHFAETHLVVLQADWTKRDPAIAGYLAGFERSGVPAYIYYPPYGEPTVLPQLLTPGSVIAATGESSR